MTRYDIYVKTCLEDKIIVSQNSKWGVIDNEDNIIIPLDYVDIELITYGIPVFKVKIGNIYDYKYGLINADGKVLLIPEYDSISSMEMCSITNMYKIRKGNKYGVYNCLTEKVIECKCDGIGCYDLDENAFYAKINGLWGKYNNSGEEIIKAEYDYIYSCGDGYICKKGKHYGMIDKSQNIILDFIYTDFNRISNNICILKVGNKYGVYKTNGEVILPCEYTFVETITTDIIKYSRQKKGNLGLILLKQNIVCEEKYDKVKHMDGHVIVWSNDKCTILNENGEERFPLQFEEIELVCKDPELFAVKQNGKYGIIKHDGSFLIHPKYSKIHSFKYGNAIVSEEMFKDGLINTQGYEVIPTVYEYIDQIDEKHLRVRKNRKYGLLETDGKMRLHIIYDFIYEISDNSARVNLGKYEGKAYFIE